MMLPQFRGWLPVILVAAVALLWLLPVRGQEVAMEPPASPALEPPPVRLLLVTATAGYHHDSIGTAQAVLAGLAAGTGAFAVTLLPDVESLAALSAETLAQHDVVFFASTSGELPLDAPQRQALLDFVAIGGGFIGTHSATDTFYEWPEYGQLIGAYFREHPWTQVATVAVEDQGHPITRGLGSEWSLFDEFYVFRANPRPHVHVLLRLDGASVGAEGDYPLAWCLRHGAGRVFYNALGHFDDTWLDSRFQEHLMAAILWAAGRLPAASEGIALAPHEVPAGHACS